jgi:hypothetical protein
MAERRIGSTNLLLLSIMLGGAACTDRIDRTLTYGSPTRDERTGILDIKFEIVLLDESDAPISGVEVGAESARSKDAAITDSAGVAVTAGEDDGIDFHFKSQRRRIEGTRSLVSYPKNQPNLRLVFKADASGRVRLTQVEY